MPDKDAPRIFSPRELAVIEYAKCEADPVYFIMKYVYIQAEQGRMLFSLFEFQRELVYLFKNPTYKRISILKSRQIGVTTVCAGYALWFILFHGDKSVMCLAPTQEKAKIIVDKVKFAYDNLPSWILKKKPFTKKNELSLILENGSSIKAASGDSDAARGFTAHILFIDEAAFINDAETLWGSAQSTLTTTHGTAISLSTPNGVGGWFHKKHTEAENRIKSKDVDYENTFVPVRLPWNIHPKRDQTWRDQQTVELGERLAKQECDCNFAASGDTVIAPDIIDIYATKYQCEPIETRGHLKDLWIFKPPIPGRDYAAIIDIARGDGSDFSTIQMMDLVENEQVAEYRGQIDTKEFPPIILSLCYEYNEALAIIERESIGWAVVKDVVEVKYKNIYYSPKEGMVMDAETYLNRNYDNDMSKMVPGFSTNVKFRPLVINSFISIVEKIAVIIHSKRSIDEWRTFIWGENGKAKAQKGYNDDLTIPLGIYGFLRDTALRFSKSAQDLTKASLESYMVARTPSGMQRQAREIDNNYTRQETDEPKIYAPPAKNPYKYTVRGRQEDCSWLV